MSTEIEVVVTGPPGPVGPEGPEGPVGPVGPHPTLTVGDVTTGTPDAEFVDDGQDGYELNLTLPPGPELSIGAVDTGATADAEVTGNPHDGYVLDLTLPPVGANGVNTGAIQNGAVTSDKIADGSIVAGDIAANANIAPTQIAGTAVVASTVDAKGDLLAGTADNTVARLPAGTNGRVLTADSTQTAGLRWAPIGVPDLDIGTVDTGTPAAASLTGTPETGYELNLTLPPVGNGSISDIAVAADADIGRTKIAGIALTAASMGVFSVLDYGADPTGVADSTAEIQAAIDAAHAVGGGTVLIPQGTYKITGAGLEAKSANIIGAVARGTGNTVATGTVLQGSSSTGPILSIIGSAQVYNHFGWRHFEGFTIRGDGVSDEYGLYMSDAHEVTLRHIMLRNHRGVPFHATTCYSVTWEDCVIQNPIDVHANDTAYIELLNCSTWRVRGVMLRALGSDTVATVGPSGAVIITDDGSDDSELNDFQFVTEWLSLAEGCLGIINHEGNLNRIELVCWDSRDFGTVTTPWAGIKLSTGVRAYGGNMVVGRLLAAIQQAPPGVDLTCYGVSIHQSNNAVHAVPGYKDKTVYLASGVEHCHIDLIGSTSDAWPGKVIDESGNTTNYISDVFTRRFPSQANLGFFGATPAAKPTVSGLRTVDPMAASLVDALETLGLIINDTTSPNLLPTANAASIETDATDWQTDLTNVTSSTRTTDWAADGTHSLQVLCAGTGNAFACMAYHAIHGIIAGQTYEAVVTRYANQAGLYGTIAINWFDASNLYLSSSACADAGPIPSTGGVGTELRHTAVAPAGATQASLLVTIASPPAGAKVYFDKFGLMQGVGARWTLPA